VSANFDEMKSSTIEGATMREASAHAVPAAVLSIATHSISSAATRQMSATDIT
jgi:hypothetical protein